MPKEQTALAASTVAESVVAEFPAKFRFGVGARAVRNGYEHQEPTCSCQGEADNFLTCSCIKGDISEPFL